MVVGEADAGSGGFSSPLETRVLPHFIFTQFSVFDFPSHRTEREEKKCIFFCFSLTTARKQECASDLFAIVVTFVIFAAFSISLQTVKWQEKEAEEIFHVRPYLIIFCCVLQLLFSASFK